MAGDIAMVKLHTGQTQSSVWRDLATQIEGISLVGLPSPYELELEKGHWLKSQTRRHQRKT